jgi:hypothetical protein
VALTPGTQSIDQRPGTDSAANVISLPLGLA